jgi:uncharacterized protein DUF4389
VTVLGVATLYLQAGTAWCQVDCLSGVLRVGDQITGVVRPDRSALPVQLTVEAIELPTGPSWELGTHLTGRIRLTGSGVEAIQVGSSLGSAAEGGPGTAVVGGPPGATGWRTLDEEERPKLVFQEAARLSRLKTAFRLVLLVPQMIVVWALGVAAYVVVILGWFGALVMGRLPTWVGEYLESYVQYWTRVAGYGFLLTDSYPPFALSAVPYPIHLQLPPRGRLNRAAVLFRFVLLIPAAFVLSLVSIGWSIASILLWLIVLILGRMPRSFFQAGVAVLRYSSRYVAYTFMLTRRYPRGLFGGEPGDEEYPIALTRDLEAAPAVDGSPTERLDLSRSARFILVWVLILGVAGFVADVALNAKLAAREARNQSVSELNHSEHSLAAALATYHDALDACQVPDRALCLEGAAGGLADEVDQFRASLDEIDPPDGSDALFADLSTKAAAFADAYHQLAATHSASGLRAAVVRLDPHSLGRAFDTANAALSAKLNE